MATVAAKTHEERVNELRQQHEAKMATLRAAGEQALLDVKKRGDEQAEEDELKNQLRREELELERLNMDRVELERRRQTRASWRRLRLPLMERMVKQEAAENEEAAAAQADHPDVRELRAFFEKVCREHDIVVIYGALAELRNGSAFTGRREVLIPKIQSFETAGIALHEAAHNLIARAPDEARKRGEDGKLLCVREEIDADKWVLAHTPIWNEKLQNFMAECLGTYRRYATESEAEEMDALCRRLTLRETQLRISNRRVAARRGANQ